MSTVATCPTHDHMTLYMCILLLFTQEEWGDTALINACREGHVTTAALLINRGAAVNYLTKVSCLHCCIDKGVVSFEADVQQ